MKRSCFLLSIVCLMMFALSMLSLIACGGKVNNFKLSFKVDSEVYQTITTTGNESITIPENPTKTGYEFDGWFWDKDVWSKPFTANSLLDAPISSDMSIYAKFNAIEYDITYNLDGGTHNNPLSYTIEDSIVLSDAEKTGYSFVGWYSDSNWTTKVETISAGTTGDTTLYAKFEIVNYAITYTNTKDVDNNNPTNYNVNSDAIALENLSKGGYTFNGWYNGEEKITEIAKESTGNLTLEARWTAIEYEVIYHNVNGAINSNPENYNVDEQPLVLAVLEKAGYNFIGWFTDENFTNEITEISVGTTGEINLYAKWEAIEYTATFMDGTTVVEEIKFTVETEAITEPAVPVHIGYNGEWEDYSLGAENITIDAVYTAIEYTATFKDGNIVVETVKFTVESEFITEPAVPNHVGYTGEWEDYELALEDITIDAVYTAIEYTATFMDGTTVVEEIKFTVETKAIDEPVVPNHVGYNGEWEEYTLGTEDITIDAVYTLIPYTIIYNNVDDATNTNPTTYNIQTQTIILVDAEKEGYTFLGWYSDEGFENEVVEITAGTVDNIELYAKWQQNEYTITFDSNGGTEVESISEYYGVTIEEPTKPSKEKYYFVGWFLASSGNAYEFTTMPAENITLYARWEAYSLTLTYDETIQGVSSLKEVTAESFGAKCVDNGGNLVDVSVTINGTVADGEVITVRLKATANGVTAQKTISNVKVYGMPTLTFDNTVDYVNINGGFAENHFGASGVDSFGQATNIEVYIDGEYEAGQLVTVTIASTDPAGNTVCGCVENVKAYGLPKITYDKTAISAHYQLSSNSLNAVAEDSFGESVNVTASCYSGTIAAGNTVIIRLSATDSKGNTNYIDVECNVYGSPRISNSSVTEIKLSDEITVDLLGITATDTFGEKLDITLTYGDKVAGEILTVTADVIDATGLNGARWEYKLKVYDNPLLTYDREGLKVNEDAEKDASVLNVVAKDSFGNLLDVEVERKSGSLIAGNYVVYTLTATDNVGNVTKLETAEIGVYDVNDIKLTYNAALTDKIKLSSKGEEFDAKATDSFGNACDITIKPAESYTLAGGNIISLYLVATDKAGNKVCSDLIKNIKIYDTPTITFNQDSYAITEETDLSFLFTVHDSFGEELYFEYIIEGEQKAGNLITVTVSVIDDAGNVVTAEYLIGVQSSEKSFVELYVNGKLWKALFIEDKDNYMLPIPSLEENHVAFWIDDSRTKYSDVNGQGLLPLPEKIQLHCFIYDKDYTLIYTIEQLQNISMNGLYLLFVDLDLNATEWTPIGTELSPFTGVFNGNGHIIYNFNITDSVQYAGLFGYNKGTITNLGVEDFSIDITLVSKSSSYSDVKSYVGGLVAYNDGGIVENSYTTGKVNISSELNRSGASSTSISNFSYVGGLVGYTYNGTITNCYTTGDVTSSVSIGVRGGWDSSSGSSSSTAGGLVGVNNGGLIQNCYTNGDVMSSSYAENNATYSYSRSYAGGLVGSNDGIINNCYATGSITAIAKNITEYGSVTNYSYSYSYAGGLIGDNDSSTVTNCGATGSVVANAITESKCEYDSNIGYSYAGGLIGYDYNGVIINCFASGNVILDSSSSSSSTRNYKSTSSNCEGGGLVGYAGGGVITNCFACGNVTLDSSSSASITDNTIKSVAYAGGLIGRDVGCSIANCYASGAVESSSNTDCNACYSKSSIVSESYVGGLVGFNNSSSRITNCYASGSLTSIANINYSNVPKTKTFNSYASGLVGYNNANTITNCYRYDGQKIKTVKNGTTSSYATNTLGTTQSKATLQSVSFHTSILGWSTDDWNFVEGEHPTLKNVGTIN